MAEKVKKKYPWISVIWFASAAIWTVVFILDLFVQEDQTTFMTVVHALLLVLSLADGFLYLDRFKKDASKADETSLPEGDNNGDQ